MSRYYAFWINPFGATGHCAVFDDEREVVKLKEKEVPVNGYPEIRNLIVIYGDKIEFEPVEVVKTWRVTSSDDASS